MDELLFEKQFDIDMRKVDLVFESALNSSIIEMFEGDTLMENASSNSLASKFTSIIKAIIDAIKRFFKTIKESIVSSVNKQKMKHELQSLKKQITSDIKVEFVDIHTIRNYFSSFLKEIDTMISKIKNANGDELDNLTKQYDQLLKSYENGINMIMNHNVNESVSTVLLKKTGKSALKACDELYDEIDKIDGILNEVESNAESVLKKIDTSVTGDTEIKKVTLFKRISSGIASKTQSIGKIIAKHPKLVNVTISLAIGIAATKLSKKLEPKLTRAMLKRKSYKQSLENTPEDDEFERHMEQKYGPDWYDRIEVKNGKGTIKSST